MSESLSYVEQLPIVKDLFNQIAKSKLSPFIDAHREAFMTSPAAATMHHNFTHGLVIHTAEVWEAAQAFRRWTPITRAIADRVESKDWFDGQELLVAVVLHDFAKIVQYEAGENHSWRKVRMICNQETWTLRELAKAGISLTDNELVGLLHAEGGYTEFEVDWRPMSVIVHAADLWSSQAMRAIWDPAQAMALKCPKCGGVMRAINGPTGLFYGCTKYPHCKGTRNAADVPPVETKFLEWLKKMYPIT
jgi:hypothetical protein